MYKIFFNSTLISSVETEDLAISLGLNLHKSSNISHNISVTKDDEEIFYFIQK